MLNKLSQSFLAVKCIGILSVNSPEALPGFSTGVWDDNSRSEMDIIWGL